MKRNTKMKLFLPTMCLAALVTGAALAMEPPTGVVSDAPLVIESVQIVDITAGRLSEPLDILVRHGRIESIESTGKLETPADARIVKARGQYLIPGLTDMHAHNMGSASLTEVSLPLFIAYGVTTIREMFSHVASDDPARPTLDSKKEWNRKIVKGELVGPRIARFGSPLVDGPDQAFPEAFPVWRVVTTEEARDLAHLALKQGYDFIKVYNHIPRMAFFALSDEATKIGLEVSGHKPRAVSLTEATLAGQRTFEHARILLFESFVGAEEFRRQGARDSFAWRVRMLHEFEPAMCREIFDIWKEFDAWYVPTHLTRKMDAMAHRPEYRNDPRLAFIPADLREDWMKDADNEVESSPWPEERQVFMDFYLKGLELTKLANEAGVNLLIGTDCNDTYVFVGSGVHDEMEEFQKAGVPAADILKIATMNAARYLANEGDFGTIAEGKIADFVVLEANPLDDIANVRRIAGVTFNGWHYDRAALDAILLHAETAASAVPVQRPD
jgi:hypothetical protein